MKYEVREWTYYSNYAATLCGFLPVEVTPAIEQAIVNDIRMHGYVLDDRSELVPYSTPASASLSTERR